MTEKKPIVCFCAGEKFLEFCERFYVENQILYIADNFKCGQVLQIRNANIPIVSMEQLDKRCQEAICVLTSMKYAEEIIHQLDGIPVCNNVKVYVYELLQEENKEISWKSNSVQVIPKKIHYCWFGKGKMPNHFQENIRSWETYCPDYEIIEWNEDNYDISKNVYMQQAYEKKAWGFVSDYARLDIVNAHGGIYMDTDVRVLKSLEVLLQYELFCGFETVNVINFGLGFGARKNHPVISDILLKYEKLRFINQDGSLNKTPCPIYQTSVLEQYGVKKNGKFQEKDHFVVFPPEYFSPINQFGYGKPSIKTFSVHQYAASWFDEGQKKDKEKMIHNFKYVEKRMKEYL